MHGIEYLNQPAKDGHPGYKGESWNVLYGCSGCELSKPRDKSTRCWAELQMPRQRANLEKRGHSLAEVMTDGKWNGGAILMPDRLSEPLHHRAPRFYAVQFMGDLFANEVPLEYIAAVQGVAAATPQHRYISLTKSVRRLEEYGRWIVRQISPAELCKRHAEIRTRDQSASVGWFQGTMDYPLPNWIQGISATCQKTLEHRWSYLARFPTRWRVISLTPRELIDLKRLVRNPHAGPNPYESDDEFESAMQAQVMPDLIILDCAAGPNAWPTDLAWIRSIIRQGLEMEIKVRVKQVGARPFCRRAEEWHVGDGIFRTAEIRDGLRWPNYSCPAGGDPSEWPEDLRVRDWLGGF